MTISHTVITDFRSDKHHIAINFIYIYLILGMGAFFDYAGSVKADEAANKSNISVSPDINGG